MIVSSTSVKAALIEIGRPHPLQKLHWHAYRRRTIFGPVPKVRVTKVGRACDTDDGSVARLAALAFCSSLNLTFTVVACVDVYATTAGAVRSTVPQDNRSAGKAKRQATICTTWCDDGRDILPPNEVIGDVVRKTQPRRTRVVDTTGLLEEMLHSIVFGNGIDVRTASTMTGAVAIEGNVKRDRRIRWRRRRCGQMAGIWAWHSSPQILGAL